MVLLAVNVITVVAQLSNAKVAPLEITGIGSGLNVIASASLGILAHPLALVAMTV